MTDYLTLGNDGRLVDREGKTLELKRDLSSPTGPLRTITAFANSAGGRLVIGIADDGTVVGVEDPLAEEERVASLIDDWISPQLVPAIDLVPLADKTVLVVDVPLSTRRPHYITRLGPEAGVYVRLGSSTRQADPALVAELERNAHGIAFENLPEPRATLTDLDLSALAELRGRATDTDDLLALGLAVRQGDQIVPTYAGILAACPDPTRFLPSAWVQCGRLRGPHGTDIFDQVEIHGPMPLAVDQAVEFLLKHAYKTAVFGEVRRRDVYSIPIEPIREVIDRVRVTIHVLSHNPADAGEHGESLSRVTKSEQPATKSSHQVESPSHEVRNPDDHRATILSLLNDVETTRTDLLSRLGLSNETRNVRRHLDPLIDAGLVERTIPDKPRSRLQRYRITDAGRAYLDRPSGDVE